MASLRLFVSTQQRARALDWRLLPLEPWWAGMEWLNGSQSTDRHGLLPGFPIEEAQLRATPRPRFPTSRSQALSVSEVRKCPSCATPKKQPEIKSTYVRSISGFRLPTTLYYSPQGKRFRTPPDEFSGAFVGKELILFDRDRYVPFQSLDLVRFHGAPELLDQGTENLLSSTARGKQDET